MPRAGRGCKREKNCSTEHGVVNVEVGALEAETMRCHVTTTTLIHDHASLLREQGDNPALGLYSFHSKL